MDQSQIANLKPQMDRLRPWVEAETGMDFAGSRIARLHDAADKVLKRFTTAANLDRLLASPQQRGLFLERLAAELTVGESFFFRNEHHFRALRDRVLPEILRDNSDKREVRIWSAGCAAGEEPYSLAILVDQLLRAPAADRQSQITNQTWESTKGTGPVCTQHPTGRSGKLDLAPFSTVPFSTDWRVTILGTDLNPAFLERAREALYRLWSFRHTKIHQDRTYFSQDGDTYRLEPHVRNMVRFAYLNLVKDVYPSPLTGTLGLDLILFRNVAIYLKPEVTRRIIERFHQALRPGGWLLLGETEVSLAPTGGFEARRFEQATFHQKAQIEKGDRSNLPEPPAASFAQFGSGPSFDAPMPVLADFVAGPPGRHDSGTVPAPRQATMPAVPGLPDWLPLPKKQAAGSPAAETAAQQIERLLAERNFDEAERAVERIANKKQRAKSRFRLVQELLAAAMLAKARAMLDRCLADEPLMIEAQLLQASFAEEAGDLEKAEKVYRRALYVDRNCPMAHFHLALVLQQKGDTVGAARSVKTTLKLIEKKDPHELVEYGEGVCYGRLKEMARMILGF